MAKVVVHDPVPSNSFLLPKGAPTVQVNPAMKRKTPSELRGEQLKRRNCRKADEVLDHMPVSDGVSGKVNGLKKSDSSKTPKYIDTRVDEVFPVKKSSNMFRILHGIEKAKGSIPSAEQIDKPTILSVACDVSTSCKSLHPCQKYGTSSNSGYSDRTVNNDQEPCSRKNEDCSQSTFRSVAELSLEKEMLSGPAIINMDKALKGLGARELPQLGLPAGSGGRFGDIPSVSSINFCSEVRIPGHKTPIDFTLKTTMRLILSSSVRWCHRLNTSNAFIDMTQFGCALDQKVCNSQLVNTTEVLFSNALRSWTYPQSSLPPSVISAMTLSAARGEMDFLLKRQLAWEDSFRSLYYLLRKNMCEIFYFCTSQFVVMFVGGDFLGKSKHSCNAYLSKSTRGLRSLLREHDICFSMPLLPSEVEQATAEDLVELSEIEKTHLGQARRLDSMSDVDNSSQSLLAFIGNDAVHGLYDFLFNYRSFLSSLTGADVPVLYSSVPFQNASVCFPKVRCKEVKRADAVNRPEGFQMDCDDPSAVCFSIEIIDTVLPPWTTCGVCTVMKAMEKSFEASFSTNLNSAGLNVAFDAISHEDANDSSSANSNHFSIMGAAVSSLQSATLRSLKYSDGSYLVTLAPS